MVFWKGKNVKDLEKECFVLNENLKSQTCCFTGHRPQKLSWKYNEFDERCIKTKIIISEEIERAINNGYTNFITGMAIGYDMIVAEIILTLKRKYKNIKLICALPCKNQCSVWSKEQQNRYNSILEKADSIRCLYDTYQKNCMQERNDYMLNNSSLLIALYNGSNGGTKYTITKANKLGIRTIIISPK